MSLLLDAIGWFFFVLAVHQWYVPKYHMLSFALGQGVKSGDLDAKDVEQSTHVLLRTFAAGGMFLAGMLLLISWAGPVLLWLYAFGVALLPGASFG